MDTGRLLIALGISVASLYAAPSASEIYQKTVKVLSIPEIKFQVSSTITSGKYLEKQIFSLSRMEKDGESSLLICFASPSKVKGTAMLLKKNKNDSQTLVYFPALDRVRLVPKQNEKEEAFGLGLSYSEIQNNKEDLSFLKTVTQHGEACYQILKNKDGVKTIYTITVNDLVLKKMDIFENELLQKEVFIDEVKELHGKTIITKWHINDHIKNQTLVYDINEDSIQTVVDSKLFTQTALTHCKS
ncbi:MAG: outer membrane lipoprotein-sorting protein [Sulfuricurvum sp.]|uniref:outer membrane lipoprotein-sorting protein n=1 Tax=Sulfuricurvum sp. TaxID=2025608 RepID=UPI002616B3C1|nr:outer membrane lipoprotein-sorting protein [Sulfuricurvum sp.]MDD2368327.1 outer membrane lipoprotein-sorting protein [Sulfuricurvum sp.]MDD5117926.1 outer membrane lipoprotein-sorting protein [Sulfuricurvum sp.]